MSATDASEYDRSVFLNCPFDSEYIPVLEAILFCLIDCGLQPRIATERLDSGETRLEKIVELIQSSRYSIHDLSRVQAVSAGEFARLNMPFELGIDYGLSRSGHERWAGRRLLVIADDPYHYQVALSDIAGWDIRAHAADYRTAIQAVRGWLGTHAIAVPSTSQILGSYLDYQAWDYERLLADGWQESDIQERTTPEVLEAMNLWVRQGRPVVPGA